MVICCLEALLQPFNFPSLRSPDTRGDVKVKHATSHLLMMGCSKESQPQGMTLGGASNQGRSWLRRAQRALGCPLFIKSDDSFVFAYQQDIWVTDPDSPWLPCCHPSPKVQSKLDTAVTTRTGGCGLSRTVEGMGGTPSLSLFLKVLQR